VTDDGWSNDPIPGFRRWSEARRVLVVADRWVDAVSKLGLAQKDAGQSLFDREGVLARNQSRSSSGSSGRGPTIVVPLPGSDARLHLRTVRHGGWFGGLLGNALLGLDRPLDELRVTAQLAQRGAPVPRPALVLAERSGLFWNATVGTVFEPDTVDGIAFLASQPEPQAILHAAAAAGRAIACFHDRGGSHHDLHVGNLILRTRPDGDFEAVVVDLDRAQRHESVDSSRRMRELMRLRRSLIKRGFDDAVGARGLARFFSAYSAGDRRLRAGLLSHLAREQRRIAVHTVLYSTRR
jgi:tRNA A-37 threonylcarbamoyl transferase component Bud32